MAEKQATKKGTRASAAKKTGSKAATARKTSGKATGFSAEERAAMRERVRELKAVASKEEGERAVLDKIAEMPEPDRAMAERLHAIITSTAPELAPRTWYGMPAYGKEGDVVCFFQNAHKFKMRYGTLGFSHHAHLDDGHMWPASYAIEKLTPDVEARIAELVKQAVS